MIYSPANIVQRLGEAVIDLHRMRNRDIDVMVAQKSSAFRGNVIGHVNSAGKAAVIRHRFATQSNAKWRYEFEVNVRIVVGRKDHDQLRIKGGHRYSSISGTL